MSFALSVWVVAGRARITPGSSKNVCRPIVRYMISGSGKILITPRI